MKQRGIAHNSALALAGDLSTKAATFLLLAVAARALTTAQFAMLATALATATLLTALLDGGVQVLLTRNGANEPCMRGPLLQALSRARLPVVVVTLVAACVFGVLAGHVALALATVLLALVGAAQLTLSGILRSAQNLGPEALSKLAAGLTTIIGGAACVVLTPNTALAVFVLAFAGAVCLAPMALAARRVVSPGPLVKAWPAMRSALPLGLMALATLVYYRAGTIALSLGSTAHETALFGAAATLGFALLALGNAITTALLPRLSGAADAEDRARATRQALGWTAVITTCVALAVIAGARPAMELAFGRNYVGGTQALEILAAASVLIGLSGILGTALIAAGRIAVVGVQVAVTLVANLVLLAVLARPFGATGAAFATLGCEALGLLILCLAAAREVGGAPVLPFGLRPSIRSTRAAR